MDRSQTIHEAARPQTFTVNTKWEDWAPTFLNFLRNIPGRNGVPLKYDCQANGGPDPTPHVDFLDEYVNMAPLNGNAFAIDATKVSVYLTSFMVGNLQAESKIQALPEHHKQNGRRAFVTLKDHYEDTGLYANEIANADHILENLFYSSEKPPHMDWTDFECQLNGAFAALDKHEGRAVYSNEMKLRLLMSKIMAPNLKQPRQHYGYA